MGPSAAFSGNPTPITYVSNTPRAVSQPCVSQKSTIPQPSYLASKSEQLQEQGFAVEVAERIAAPQRSSARTVYKLMGPCLKSGVEGIWRTSHLL